MEDLGLANRVSEVMRYTRLADSAMDVALRYVLDNPRRDRVEVAELVAEFEGAVSAEIVWKGLRRLGWSRVTTRLGGDRMTKVWARPGTVRGRK